MTTLLVAAVLDTILTLMIEVFVPKPPKEVVNDVLLAAAPEPDDAWEVVVAISCCTVMGGWLVSITTNVAGVTVVTGATVTELPLLTIPASV